MSRLERLPRDLQFYVCKFLETGDLASFSIAICKPLATELKFGTEFSDRIISDCQSGTVNCGFKNLCFDFRDMPRLYILRVQNIGSRLMLENTKLEKLIVIQPLADITELPPMRAKLYSQDNQAQTNEGRKSQ